MFQLTEEQQSFADSARAFCRELMGSTLRQDDENEVFRKEFIHALGEQGLTGIPTPEEYGGLGLGYLDYAIVLEAIAEVSSSYAVSVAVTGLPQVILAEFGTEVQKERWLPGLAAGELLGAFALSEPGSGSDAASLSTTARKVDGGYVLDGTKFWITHGGYADMYIVMARKTLSSGSVTSSHLKVLRSERRAAQKKCRFSGRKRGSMRPSFVCVFL